MEEEFAGTKLAARKTTKISQIAPAEEEVEEEEHDDREGGGLMVVRPPSSAAAASGYCSAAPVRLTVWCKSLLFNGNGYTVYDDADGRMVFRVDNYAHDWRRETVLMDFAGNVLLTIRRCRPNLILNLRESWEAYKGDHNYNKLMTRRDRGILDDGGEEEEGEEEEMKKRRRRLPVFKATKELGSHGCSISMLAGGGSGAASFGYRMKWSRQKDQSSMIYHRQAANSNTLVAEVSRKYGSMQKKMLDKDVLTLRVQPGMDQALAMAMLMITNSMRF